MTVMALTEQDRSLIDMAYQLAKACIEAPPTRDECELCAELRVPCIAHRGPNDWPRHEA